MEFPKLIGRSKHIEPINDNDDFGLERFLNLVFDLNKRFIDGDLLYYDLSNNALTFARNILYYPDGDVENIEKSQMVLSDFMKNDTIRNYVLNQSVVATPNSGFKSKCERLHTYIDYLDGLSSVFPRHMCPEIHDIKNNVDFFLMEKADEYRNMLDEIETGDIHISLSLIYDGDYARVDHISFEKIYPDMTKISVDDCVNSLYARTLTEVLSKYLVNFVDKVKPISFDMDLTYHGDDMILKGKYSDDDGEVSPDKSVIDSNLFKLKINADAGYKLKGLFPYIGKNKYGDMLSKFADGEFKDFLNYVAQLRYFALAADYFNDLEKKGVNIAFPQIVESDKNDFEAKTLINPLRFYGINVPSDGTIYISDYGDVVKISEYMALGGLPVLAESASLAICQKS